METRRATHPTAEVLQAFGLGKLDDSSTGALMAHLDLCVECRKSVASISGDDFLDRLRQAHGRSGTPAPPKSLGGMEGRPKPPPGPTTLFNLPPELADNAQYEILRELGRGGMGVVYLAKNKLMDRLEVLKVINKSLLDRPGAVERFLREIRSAAKLNHVNVVAAYSALQLGDLLVFAMEYIEGQDLAAVVKAQGPLPVPHACFYVQQAAQGLQHAFEKSMVHRDIKPQNLILAREGRKHLVKVLDFGLAKVIQEKADDTGLTGEGKMLGTPDYMAPEQTLDATSADIRADIYSLGCTLYFLLSGSRPFKGKNLFDIMQAHQSMEAPAVNVARPEVPAELAAVVRKMMAKDRSQRYQTPLEVVQALKPFIKQVAASKSSPGLSVAGAQPAVAPMAKVACPSLPTLPTNPAATPPVAWDTLTETDSVIASAQSGKNAVIRNRPSGGAHSGSRKGWLLGGAGAVGLLVLGSLGYWLATVLLRVATPNGTLVVEINDDEVEARIKSGKLILSGPDGKVRYTLTPRDRNNKLEAGAYKIRVEGADGLVLDTPEFTLKKGGEVKVRVTLAPKDIAKNTPTSLDPDRKPDDKDFVSLFNGKDLTGWTTTNGKAAQWEVEDGYLEVFPGKGDIRTKKDFGPNFKLHVEFWLPLMADKKGQERANSGVFLQGRYEIQILDSYRNDTYAAGDVGALYRTIAPDKEAQKKAIRKPETWNTLDITFHSPRVDEKGTITEPGRITVILNDVTIINDATFFQVSGGALDNQVGNPGPIALQDHGAKVRFRNIKIRELPRSKKSSLDPDRKEAGENRFVSLFNGKDLTGWKTHPNQPGDWRVKDGVLIGSGTISHLFTDRGDFKNFHLRAEVRVNEDGNSGICFRTPFNLPNGSAAPSGYEAQILHRYDKPAPLTGSLVKFVNAPILGLAADEWFTLEIIAVGNELTIKVNNKTTAHYIDEKRTRMQGHFALQVWKPETTVVQFRKIEFKELLP